MPQYLLTAALKGADPGDSKVAVGAAAVGDPKRQYEKFGVPDRVDHSMVTDSDTPKVGVTNQGATVGRPWIDTQGVNCADDATRDGFVNLVELFESFTVVLDGIGNRRGHNPSALATSAAGIAVLRPASRSASRSVAIRASSRSTMAS